MGEEPRWCDILGLCDFGHAEVTKLLRAAEEAVRFPLVQHPCSTRAGPFRLSVGNDAA